MDKKVLFDNHWIQVIEKETANNGKYIYSHGKWNNGVGVAILPFKKCSEGYNFLGRYEICPSHSDELELCSITGGYDNADKFTLEQCVLNELREEGGYLGSLQDLVYLGQVRPSKSSDTTIHLYTIDLFKCEPCEAVSDGTLGEVGAYCKLLSENEIIKSQDPLIHAMMIKMITQDVI